MFQKKLPQKPTIGMVIDNRGIAAASSENATGTEQLKHFDVDDWLSVKQWVDEIKPSTTSVHLVLDNKQYHIHQVETPKVPEEELNQALLYSLRDRLEHPITEMQLDHYQFPTDAQRGGEKKVNVVTSHTPLLKEMISGLKQSGLKPAIINIAELAIGKLLTDRESMSKGVCFLAYQEKQVTFVIYKDGQLYLSRSVMINSWDDCVNPEVEFAREGLLLEIQRTLDYYQSQMVQPPVSELIIPDWGDPLDPLIDYLVENLSMNVNQLSFRENYSDSQASHTLRQIMIAKSALIEENNSAEG